MKRHTLKSVREKCETLTESNNAVVIIGDVSIKRTDGCSMALSLGNVSVTVHAPAKGQRDARTMAGRFNTMLPHIVAMVNEQ